VAEGRSQVTAADVRLRAAPGKGRIGF